MNPTEIKNALSELGGRANKSLGQHFLIDKKALEVIVETADIHKGDMILEVGPGLGVLTFALLDRGAEVVAIEQDQRFVDYLNSYRALRTAYLKIIYGDAAKIHWHELVLEKNWKFVANLPYSITSLALRKALYSPRPPSNVVVLVQREVGERAREVASGVVNSKFGKHEKEKTSLLSLMMALASSSVRIVSRVSAGAFYPPPKVESVILQIIPMTLADRIRRWGVEPEKIMEIARHGFAHPRKFLKSNLLSYVRVNGYSPGLQGSFKMHDLVPLQEACIPEKARAEDLSPDDWARLAGLIINRKL